MYDRESYDGGLIHVGNVKEDFYNVRHGELEWRAYPCGKCERDFYNV